MTDRLTHPLPFREHRKPRSLRDETTRPTGHRNRRLTTKEADKLVTVASIAAIVTDAEGSFKGLKTRGVGGARRRFRTGGKGPQPRWGASNPWHKAQERRHAEKAFHAQVAALAKHRTKAVEATEEGSES
jgi:hypothetical protein